MSATRRRSLRRPLAAAAVAGSLALASCTGGTGGDGRPGPEPRPDPSPPTSADVADPSPARQILTDPATPQPLRTAERPNLLMITVDDAALKDMPFMPHLQDLVADEGVTLNGVAPTPICVPARASLVTGQYAHNHGALTINGEGGGFPAFRGEGDDDTLPVWLEQAGYDTIFLGKYLNGYNAEAAAEYEPPGWTVWRPTLDPQTYNYTAPVLLVDGEPTEIRQYSTTLLRDQSETFIRQRADSPRPWYMWVNYVAPHSGGPREDDDPAGLKTPAREERDRGTFADLPNSDTPDMFEADVRDKVLVPATQKRYGKKKRAALTEGRRQRIESLQSVDRAVRSTIRTLRETGQLDSTYVVFTSDNGFALGEHNITGKLFYFTDIVHVPMYIRGPGIPRGATAPAPVTNADWAPTFAALAGVPPGRDVDGVDVLPYLTGDARRRVVPIEAYPVQGGRTPLYQGVLVGPWTYARGRGGREELYNRDLDEFELVNLRRDPRFRAHLRVLRRLTDRYAECAAAECRTDFLR